MIGEQSPEPTAVGAFCSAVAIGPPFGLATFPKTPRQQPRFAVALRAGLAHGGVSAAGG